MFRQATAVQCKSAPAQGLGAQRYGTRAGLRLLGAGLAVLSLVACDGEPVTTAVAEEPSPQVDAAILAGFQHDIDQALAAWEVPGAAIVVVSHDHVLYSRGFGLRNIDKDQVVTPRTLFRVAAATPALTSTLLGTLVDDNRLEWDTPLADISPALLRVSQSEDLAALLSEPSSDAEAAGAPVDAPYVLAACAAASRFSENSGDAKSSFHHLMQRKLFGPAGMTMTALGNQLPAMSEDYATPYHHDAQGRLMPMNFPELDAKTPVGAASTAIDMARFLILHIQGGIAQSGKRVASPTNLAETRKSRRPLLGADRALWPLAGEAGRGMGWVSFELAFNNQRFEGFNGGVEGFSVQVGFLTQSGIGLVVLNNKDPSSGGVAFNAEVRDRLISRLFRAEYPPPSPLG